MNKVLFYLDSEFMIGPRLDRPQLTMFKAKQQMALNFQPLASNNTTNNNSPGGAICGICLRPLGSCESLVEHGGAWYHAACANLWVNRVELTLPALARES